MGEMVDWKMDTFASEYEATDATRCGPDGVSCLRESIHQVWAGEKWIGETAFRTSR